MAIMKCRNAEPKSGSNTAWVTVNESRMQAAIRTPPAPPSARSVSSVTWQRNSTNGAYAGDFSSSSSGSATRMIAPMRLIAKPVGA